MKYPLYRLSIADYTLAKLADIHLLYEDACSNYHEAWYISKTEVDRSEEAMLVNMCVNIKKVTREGKIVQVNWTG